MARNVPDDVDTGGLIRRKLRYEMADANAVDEYCFSIKEAGNVCVHYDGAGARRDLRFSPDALESARRHIVLSQGYAATTDARDLPSLITNDLPSFLFSREVFASLKNKGNADFTFEWSNDVSIVSVTGTGHVAILVEGKSVRVPVLQCAGSRHECKLSVIDDGNWPIILKHEEQDGFYWRLLELV